MTGAAATIGALAERRTVKARVMIVVAHPDDETIGMGAQLNRFDDALLVQVTDGAPRDGRDAAAHGSMHRLPSMLLPGVVSSPLPSMQERLGGSEPTLSGYPIRKRALTWAR